MKKSLILLAIFAILFSGCGTKRKYFDPEGHLMSAYEFPTESLPDSIRYISRNGATLDNGDLITKNGLVKGANLVENDVFLGEYEGKYLVSNLDGNFKIISDGNVIYNRKFERTFVSATLEGTYLAAVDASNKIYLVDLSSDSIIIEYASSTSYAIDARAAAPVFLSSVIVYPTLDGKVMIVDKNLGRIIRDAVVSSDPFFNNVIFLDVKEDKLFAATLTKLIMISPERTEYYENDIKDIAIVEDRVYILLKDGNIEVTDLNLKTLRKKEFEYAIFSNIIPKGDTLYIFEKTGYIIVTDLYLEDEVVVELGDEIDSKSFAGKNTLYFDDKMIIID